MKIHEIVYLLEATHDAEIVKRLNIILSKYRPYEQNIIKNQFDQIKKWFKNRRDRMMWLIKAFETYYGNEFNSQVAENFFEKIKHYFARDQIAPAIENFNFDKDIKSEMTIFDVFEHFQGLQAQFDARQSTKKPVVLKEGDYIIPLKIPKDVEIPWKIKNGTYEPLVLNPDGTFKDGTAWVFVDRAYCREEGRSGQHCGNAEGNDKTDQRILSLRKMSGTSGHVILTFILHPDNSLGEMKAKGNQKPSEDYHPHIMALLLSESIGSRGQIKKIAGKGFMAYNNFNIFDLNEQNLSIVDAFKPNLIKNQLELNVFDILKPEIPEPIKIKYFETAKSINPDIGIVFNDNSFDAWAHLIYLQPQAIIFLPKNHYDEYDDFWNKVAETIFDREVNYDEKLLKQAPKSIAKNEKFVKKLIHEYPRLIDQVNQNLKIYPELCEYVIKRKPEYISEIQPTIANYFELAKYAVDKNIHNLDAVKISSLDNPIELYKFSLKRHGPRTMAYLAHYIHLQMDEIDSNQLFEYYKLIAEHHPNEFENIEKLRLEDLPHDKKIELFKQMAVGEQFNAIISWATDELMLDQEFKQLIIKGIKENPSLIFRLKDLQDYENLAKIALDFAIKNFDAYYVGRFLFRQIPESLRTYELSKFVIEKDPNLLQYVPNTIKNYNSLVELAVKIKPSIINENWVSIGLKKIMQYYLDQPKPEVKSDNQAKIKQLIQQINPNLIKYFTNDQDFDNFAKHPERKIGNLVFDNIDVDPDLYVLAHELGINPSFIPYNKKEYIRSKSTKPLYENSELARILMLAGY